MRLRSSAKLSYLALAAGLSLLGCGAEFDRVSEIETLRVFGVEKSSPYAQPGETVRLSLSFHDGTPVEEGQTRSPIRVAWLSGCYNPPGDLYAGCFATPPESFAVAYGNEFALTLPEDVIIPREPPMIPYGLAYVFFAVCAGDFSIEESSTEGLPLRCRDGAGRDLGPRDFVAGYTAIYSFGTNAAGAPYANANPEVSGFMLNGQELSMKSAETPDANVCLADDCLGECSEPVENDPNDQGSCVNVEPAPVDCAAQGAPCVRACADDGDSEKCEANKIRPLIDQSMQAEIDEISRDVYGRNYQEQMWINYYATRGAVKSDARLLNDATQGWNSDYGTEFYAPKEPGPVQVWAVVHDNRGAMTWVGATLQVMAE
jgi:hypothetical protein